MKDIPWYTTYEVNLPAYYNQNSNLYLHGLSEYAKNLSR